MLLQKNIYDQAINSISEYLQYFEKKHLPEQANIEIQSTNDVMMNYQKTQIKIFNDYITSFSNSDKPKTSNDKRFKHESWDSDPFFNYNKQVYIAFSHWVNSSLDAIENIDSEHKRQFKFFAKLLIEAVSPSNFPNTNPEVIARAFETNGESLINGMNNLLRDTNSQTGELTIKNCNMEAFKIGENIAYTPGKVVFQNALMQLIQYEPTTKQVFKTPLLIIPAWINKYYIFDLQSHNSFIKWAVDNGHTVYIISWVNPDIKYKNKCFEDYVKFGPMAALKFIKQSTGESQVNAIGYCLGGIILTSLMGMLGKDANKYFKSASLFATLIDFSKAGDLLLFSHGSQGLGFQSKIKEQGFLDSKTMSQAFNSLKANDMVWSAFINNYLLGKEPPSFDILYWNADSTNLPAKMYDFYIKSFFKENKLMRPNSLSILGKSVDITQIKVPSFILGTVDDHIAPWQSSFPATQMFAGDCKYILAGSGHVAGVINPSGSNKYGYWSNDAPSTDPTKWLADATKQEGSWWNTWQNWVASQASEMISAHARKVLQLPLADAPGSYIKM